jgi:glycosyltransferase involved in cell wall biosynthesis
VRVAFVVPDVHLSGGINVIVHHAIAMAARPGWSVALVASSPRPAERWPYPGIEDIELLHLADVADDHFDIALATWWGTVRHLPLVPADRYAYFVQSLEDRFAGPMDLDTAYVAGATYHLGLPTITEAGWIADLLRAQNPGVPCHLVRNGVDKKIFAPVESVEVRSEGPLRLLVEGSRHVPFKGVGDALDAISKMKGDRHVTLVAIDDPSPHPLADRVEGRMSQSQLAKIYAETDVFVKLPRVEGMFGPPIEAFHLGATCVVSPVTGHDEYIEHGWNALVAAWDDPTGTGRLLDLLSADRRLLHQLRFNALGTARAWPSWPEASNRFALALMDIRHRPVSVDRQVLLRLVRHLWRTPGNTTAARVARDVLADLRPRVQPLRDVHHSVMFRALDAVERPIRRVHPGLGTARQRVEGVAESLDRLDDDVRARYPS